MGRSAGSLGREFGLGARAMNALLKEHGYLYGEPGAYRLTEKGARFGTQLSHHSGNPQSLMYSAQWETRTWNEDTADALRADIEAGPAAPDAGATSLELATDESDYFGTEGQDAGGGEVGPTLKDLVAGVAVLGAFVVLAPPAKRLWEGRVRPAAQAARDRLVRRLGSNPEPEPQGESTPHTR